MHLTCRWGHLRLRRAAEPRGHRRGHSLCRRWLGNLPCCEKISRGCISNTEMLGYGQCNDALRGHSLSTLQEDITIATSTCPSEKRVTAHAQQVYYVIAWFANITGNCNNVEPLGDFLPANDRRHQLLWYSVDVSGAWQQSCPPLLHVWSEIWPGDPLTSVWTTNITANCTAFGIKKVPGVITRSPITKNTEKLLDAKSAPCPSHPTLFRLVMP